MFIDTHTRETMLRSFCSVLRISQYELRDVIWEIYRSTGNDYDDCISKIEAFIYERISDESLPDEILLFHFARRLKGTEEDTIGRNLADLLTTPNALSDFLKDHQLTFEMGEQHIETYYKGNVVDWDKVANEIDFAILQSGLVIIKDEKIFALTDLLLKIACTRMTMHGSYMGFQNFLVAWWNASDVKKLKKILWKIAIITAMSINSLLKK